MRKIAIWGMAVVLVACMAGMAMAATQLLDGKTFTGAATFFDITTVPGPPVAPTGHTVVLRIHNVSSSGSFATTGFAQRLIIGEVDVNIDGVTQLNIPFVGQQASTTLPASVNIQFVTPAGVFPLAPFAAVARTWSITGNFQFRTASSKQEIVFAGGVTAVATGLIRVRN